MTQVTMVLLWLSSVSEPAPRRKYDDILAGSASLRRFLIRSTEREHDRKSMLQVPRKFDRLCQTIEREYAGIADRFEHWNDFVVALVEVEVLLECTRDRSVLRILDIEQSFMLDLYNREPIIFLKIRRAWPLEHPVKVVRELGHVCAQSRTFEMNSVFLQCLRNSSIVGGGSVIDVLSLQQVECPRDVVGISKPLAGLSCIGKWHDISIPIPNPSNRSSRTLSFCGIDSDEMKALFHVQWADQQKIREPLDVTKATTIHNISSKVRELADLIPQRSEDLEVELEMRVASLDSTADSLDARCR